MAIKLILSLLTFLTVKLTDWSLKEITSHPGYSYYEFIFTSDLMILLD